MPRRLPVWKKTVFAAVTLVLFFAVVEGLLTLAGVRPVLDARDPFVGFAPLPLFVEERQPDGRVMLRTARNKLPWFNDQQFPKQKSSPTYRIFCVGGSTTQGQPYDDATAFSGWLRELLPLVDPSREWEVINAGGISYASYRVAALMEELAAYEPDLFVVYSGHNEFLEERTYREMRRLPAPLLKTAALLSRTRTWAAMSAVSGPERTGQDDTRHELPAEVDALLDRSVGPSAYRRDDRLREQVIEHFELNLLRMADIARACGAEVLFVTPASNLKDCSPFKSEHRDGLAEGDLRQWTWLYERARSRHEQNELEDALALYRQAERIDGRFAELHYRLGRVLFELGRHDEARTAFERAVDEDVCPLRALTEMPSLVARIALKKGAAVVDYQALVAETFLREHGHAVPGEELFLDHVHPTIAGHRLLAVALVERLIEQRTVRPGPSWKVEAVQTATERIEGRIDQQAHAVALRNLAKVLAWAGRHHEAGPLALRALETLPDDAEGHYLAGCYYRMIGRTDDAVASFRRALPHRTSDAEAHQLFAAALVEQGSLDEALVHYSQAIRLRPNDPDVRHRLGAVFAQQGDYRNAVAHYRQALRLKPDDPDLHYNLGYALDELGETTQAATHYNEALRLNPDDTTARNRLGRLRP